MVKAPVLTGLTARFEGLEVFDVEPAHLPDVLGDRPVVVFGKWRGQPQGHLVLEGHSATGPFRQVLPTQVVSDTPALRHLWARHRIASLGDQVGLDGSEALRQRITDLGLAYSLLTQYTSFIAVDEVVRNAAPQGSIRVQQPVPLPQGVGNLAVGAEVSSTPEPATWGAVLLVLSLLAVCAHRSRRHRSQRWTA
jgi:Ca-activated chloride channel family protein